MTLQPTEVKPIEPLERQTPFDEEFIASAEYDDFERVQTLKEDEVIIYTLYEVESDDYTGYLRLYDLNRNECKALTNLAAYRVTYSLLTLVGGAPPPTIFGDNYAISLHCGEQYHPEAAPTITDKEYIRLVAKHMAVLDLDRQWSNHIWDGDGTVYMIDQEPIYNSSDSRLEGLLNRVERVYHNYAEMCHWDNSLKFKELLAQEMLDISYNLHYSNRFHRHLENLFENIPGAEFCVNQVYRHHNWILAHQVPGLPLEEVDPRSSNPAPSAGD